MWLTNLSLAISIGHVLHLAAPQYQFPSALCAFDVSSALTKRSFKFLGDERQLMVVKEKPFVVHVDLKYMYEGYLDVVCWLFPEMAKWDDR